MKYPKNIKTIKEKIIYQLYKEAALHKDDIAVANALPKSILCELSQLTSERLVVKDRIGRFMLTERGILQYSKNLKKELVIGINTKLIMTMFTKGSKPKTILDVVLKLYPNEQRSTIVYRVRHRIKLLINKGILVALPIKNQKYYYVAKGSRYDPKLTNEPSDAEVAATIQTERAKERLIQFYRILPGTLTGNPSGVKECTY